MRVLADPWDPGYGMGFSIDEDLGEVQVDLGVEARSWSEPLAGSVIDGHRVAFVDGVRRIELRLLLAEGDRRVAGALGSLAVGCAFGGREACFDEILVDRLFVAGGALKLFDALRLDVGGVPVTWRTVAVLAEDDLAAQLAIHNEMRRLEADVSRRVAERDCDLVLVDGPLGFLDPTGVPVVGVVKRSVRRYLEGEAAALLPRLGPGQRTPLFSIGEGSSQRYSWYARLTPLREAWHDHAGLVRCELSTSHGITEASRLADEVTTLLPRYAGGGTDPRTPQNLTPIASLERRLRHALGDETLLRRAALAELTRRERSAS